MDFKENLHTSLPIIFEKFENLASNYFYEQQKHFELPLYSYPHI